MTDNRHGSRRAKFMLYHEPSVHFHRLNLNVLKKASGRFWNKVNYRRLPIARNR
jgi:hypothetical protein